MRGLKLNIMDEYKDYRKSHLLQMRGLKPVLQVNQKGNCKSHLLQMRGLKQEDGNKILTEQQVASFTDAWIETIIDARTLNK